MTPAVASACQAPACRMATPPAMPKATTVNGVTETVGPWLKEQPSSANYSISLDGSGNVQVNGHAYDNSPNPCSSLNSGGS